MRRVFYNKQSIATIMNTQQTLEQLKELKLYGMAGCYDTQLHQPAEKQPDAHTLMAMMTEAEAVSRIHQRTNLYLRLARFRYNVLPEQLSCTAERTLSQEPPDVVNPGWPALSVAKLA